MAQKETTTIRTQVITARDIQTQRFHEATLKIFTNSEMSSKQCDSIANVETAGIKFLEDYSKKNYLSARGYYRTIKVGRTIADLENSETITSNHLAEAVSYRIREEE